MSRITAREGCRHAPPPRVREASASGRADRAGPRRIVKLHTAVPDIEIQQADVYAHFMDELYDELPQAEEIFAKANVRKRRFAMSPRQYQQGYPSLGPRMRAWETHAVDLSHRAMKELITDVDTDDIGTLVMVSSTGYTNPGPDVSLARLFGLRSTLRRSFIGHMGCYAAFNGLKVALDAVAARPTERAVVGCVELSSLHMRNEVTVEQAVAHALFGDAAAMVMLSGEAGDDGIEVLATHTRTFYEAYHAMSLHIHDDSFRMSLSPEVPRIIGQEITAFVAELTHKGGLSAGDIAHWGIHPGGPKIVDQVGRALGLSDTATAPSRQVLAEYGNCASVTILLILDEILRSSRPVAGEYGVLLGFGPGLTIEGMLIRFLENSQEVLAA